jgi:hypothetical protein
VQIGTTLFLSGDIGLDESVAHTGDAAHPGGTLAIRRVSRSSTAM